VLIIALKMAARVFVVWREGIVGDKDSDGEGRASMPGRMSYRMLENRKRSMSRSTFSTAEVMISWKPSTCTGAVDEAVNPRQATMRKWRVLLASARM
jgi:hypothetical protein